MAWCMFVIVVMIVLKCFKMNVAQSLILIIRAAIPSTIQ